MHDTDTDWRTFGGELLQSAAGTFWDRLGCRLTHVEAGKAAIEIDMEAWHKNHLGILHGGVHASLLDQSMGIAAFTARPGVRMVTTNLNVHFLKPPADGTVSAAAEIIHVSRHMITVQGRVCDCGGNLCAYGSATYRVAGSDTGKTHDHGAGTAAGSTDDQVTGAGTASESSKGELV